jgi:SOS response associated peptidase (SRAP)
MCGRFTATFEFSDIRVRWNLDRDLPKYTPRFNIAPETSPNIPVIVRQKGVNECRLMHWGLIPHWTADPSIGNRMINARAETLTELPSFKPLVDRRRCIIPASNGDGLANSPRAMSKIIPPSRSVRTEGDQKVVEKQRFHFFIILPKAYETDLSRQSQQWDDCSNALAGISLFWHRNRGHRPSNILYSLILHSP